MYEKALRGCEEVLSYIHTTVFSEMEKVIETIAFEKNSPCSSRSSRVLNFRYELNIKLKKHYKLNQYPV